MKVMGNTTALGKAIREIRLAAGVSQEELAARCGLDRTYLSGVERGVRNPTVSVVEKIASGLGVSLADLFNRAQTEGETNAVRS
jgi:transcriptional regulator with XRE-family HTH domain